MAAGLPKGSFYHYFESKERFALEAMNDFIATFPEELPDKNLNRKTFEKMIDSRIKSIIEINFTRECYLSVMTHAFTEQDDTFRQEVLQAIEQSNAAMFRVLRSLQKQRKLRKGIILTEFMEFIDFTWRGARMKARLSNSERPLNIFKKYVLNYLMEP